MIRPGGRGRALGYAIFWAAVGVASYVFGVQSEVGQTVEDSVLDAAEFTMSPPAPLNLVSTGSVAIALVIVGIIGLAVHGIRRALVVTVVPAVAIVVSQLLKQQLLTRPQLFELDLPNTFPSGHMTIFTALIAGLVWAVPTRARALVSVAGAVVLAAAGWQLLAYGWHRPSDVFGAIALGCIAFAVAGLIGPARTRGEVRGGGATSVGLAIVGWVVTAGAIALAAYAALASNSDLLLVSGEFGAVGVSALASRSLLRLSVGRD